MTKTRLQLQGQLGNKKTPYRGMLRTALGISESSNLYPCIVRIVFQPYTCTLCVCVCVCVCSQATKHFLS